MDIAQIYAFLMQNTYLKAFIIFALFFIFARIGVYISERYFLKIAEKTKTNVDNLIIEKTNKPVSFVIILIGLKIALAISYKKEFLDKFFVSEIINSIIVFILAYLVIKVFDILIDNWGRSFAQRTKSKMDEQLLSLFHKFSRIVFFILTLLFILQIWGIQIGALLASLGIAGLAIAFALQSSLGNIFGGISLILDKSIRVGDRIKLESGESGIIDDVGLRSTRIKTWDNQIIVVPNGKLADSKIINYLHRGEKRVRVTVDFSVVYGAKLDKVKKTIIPELKKIKECLKDPAPDVYFKEMADFSLNFQAKLWVSDVSKAYMTKQEANIRIYNALNKAKIGIPFPTQTIYVKRKAR